MILKVIDLLRPQQWVKNVFVFLPLFFDKHLTDWNYLSLAFVAFVAFSFMASAIYCFNDIWDVEADRLHPKKCKRPLASGALTRFQGYIIMAVMILLSLLVTYMGYVDNFAVMIRVICVTALYLVMNILYTVKLKQIAIIDVFIIAAGFVLRVVAGGYSSNIILSHWIILMTFLLALFLALAKRRDDVVIYEEFGIKARKNVSRYSLVFMNQIITVVATVTLVCYIMYTMSPDVIQRVGTSNLYLTFIWVLLGVIRYMQITIVDVKSGSPTKILMHDHFIQFTILGWIFTYYLILYI